MIDWTGLMGVFAAFFIVAASPGPATLAIGAISASSGRKYGMIFGAGLSTGLAFWGLVAATGFGAILQTSAFMIAILKIIGGIYLLWLAYGSAHSAMRLTAEKPDSSNRDWKKESSIYFKGLLLNLSNPKAVLAWMAALSVGLGADDTASSVIIATLGCVFIGFIVYAVYASAFSLSFVMSVYAKLRRRVDITSSALFAIAGFSLLRSAIAHLKIEEN